MPPMFLLSIRLTVLWLPCQLLPSYVYVAITLYGVAFQPTLTFQVRTLAHGPKHHISFAFLQRIQFALCCFHSLLLAASRLISFPAGTKTFQFPAFPVLTDLMLKSHQSISGSMLTCSYPELIAACHALHQRLSRVIHLIAFFLALMLGQKPMHGLMNFNLNRPKPFCWIHCALGRQLFH